MSMKTEMHIGGHLDLEMPALVPAGFPSGAQMENCPLRRTTGGHCTRAVTVDFPGKMMGCRRKRDGATNFRSGAMGLNKRI